MRMIKSELGDCQTGWVQALCLGLFIAFAFEFVFGQSGDGAGQRIERRIDVVRGTRCDATGVGMASASRSVNDGWIRHYSSWAKDSYDGPADGLKLIDWSDPRLDGGFATVAIRR